MHSLRHSALAIGCLALLLSTPVPFPLWAGAWLAPGPYLWAAEAAPPASIQWPREFDQDGYTFTVYQPQADSWTDEVLKVRMAVQVSGNNLEKPAFGAVFAQAKTATDLSHREVTLTDFKVTKVEFPTLGQDVKNILLNRAMPKQLVVSLDQVTANLARTQNIGAKKEVPLDSQPPEIFFSEKKPSILVLIGGPPQMRELTGTPYMYVLNSEWVIVMDSKTNTYYLLTDTQWLSSQDLMKGPWVAAKEPPGLDKAPADSRIAEALKQAKPEPGAPVPAVFVSTKQAVLLDFDGPPTWTPVEGTGLLYASNIDQPVLNQDGTIYVLLSGRWFEATSLRGPWHFIIPYSLPADFAKIPASSPIGQEVLTSIPNTPEAKEAVIMSQIPHKATVTNREVQLKVTYDGEPKFEPIEGTSMKRAINTSYVVILCEGKYYCCENAVWFAASSPMGPWAVTSTVPQEIYTIPPTSPVYNVTYVQVYDSTPETTTFGYTAGYLGAFIAGGLVVYGLSQLWAPRYYWYGRYYYPPPYTYAWGRRYYNPYTGAYGVRGYWGGPGYWSRGGARYNPYTGRYAYGHRTSTPYASWGKGVVGNTDGRWAHGGYYRNWRGGVAGASGSEGNKGFVAHSKVTGNTVYGGKKGDDYYVGRDGNVYRYSDGSWSKYNNGGWQPAGGNQTRQERQASLKENAPNYAKNREGSQPRLTDQQRQAAQERVNQGNRQPVRPQTQPQREQPIRPQNQNQNRLQRQEQIQRAGLTQDLQRQRQSREIGQFRSREFHRQRAGGGFERRRGGGGGGFRRR